MGLIRLSLGILFLTKLVLIGGKVSNKEYALLPNVFHLDDYDKCTLHRENFIYCVIEVQLAPINASITWKHIKELSSDPRNYRHDLLRHGLCISELNLNITKGSYHNHDIIQHHLTNYYNQKYKDKGLKCILTEMRCQTEKPSYTKDIYYSIFYYFSIAYGSILLVVTFIDIVLSYFPRIPENFSFKIISALSLRKNWQRLMTVNLPTQEMKDLSCLQGFRVYCTILVVIVHNVEAFFKVPPINPHYAEQEINNNSRILMDPTHLMQVFFMISTLLLYKQILCAHEKGEKLSVRYFFNLIVKRYIRLTPTLATILIFTRTYFIHYSQGPLWDYIIGNTYRRCRKNGWANFFYIQNFFIEMCLGHTWYLAVNFQFYILSLPLIYFMVEHPKRVLQILSSLFIIHVTYMFLVFYRNNYPFKPTVTLEEMLFQERFSTCIPLIIMHFSNYANSAGFIAGLIVGYIYSKTRRKKIFTKKIHVAMWWLVVCFAVEIVRLDTLLHLNNQFYISMYGSLKRILFVLSVGVLFIGMVQGQGWFLKWMCETTPIYILGRLTYPVYVIHPIIQYLQVGSRRSLNFLNEYALVRESIRDITLSFIFAIIVALFIEMPMIEIHKLCSTSKKELNEKKICLEKKN